MNAVDSFASKRLAPPRLHWFWVFLLSALTSYLFAAVWLVVLAHWARRVQGYSQAFGWSIAALVSSALFATLAFWQVEQVTTTLVALVLLFLLLHCTLWLIAVFTLRSELQDEPVGLILSGFVTFLFSSIYFQYHLHDYPVQQLSYPGESSLVNHR